jgi:hypothetical protein
MVGGYSLVGLQNKIKIMARFICILLIFVVSCKAPQGEDGKVFIEIDGHNIEMVADEYDNQYLKQFVSDGRPIYIPFTFETEEIGDTLHSFQAKIKQNAK